MLEHRFVYINDQRQAIALEPAFWPRLEEICRRQNMSVHDICSQIATADPTHAVSAIRVHVLTYFSAAATEEGHSAAGHGAGG